MDKIRRIFVEKKEAFAVEARGMLADLQTNLGMKGLTGIRVLNRYDVMGVTDEEFAAAKGLVLSEPPVDSVCEATRLKRAKLRGKNRQPLCRPARSLRKLNP